MRFLLHLHLLTATILSLIGCSHGFAFAPYLSTRGHTHHQTSSRGFFQLASTPNNSSEEPKEFSQLKIIDKIISDMHESKYPFRIVVIGNGAILETTSPLGPTMKSSVSPKTNQRLVTLASKDQSFEFHIKVDEVAKILFVETIKPVPAQKVLRICRFVREDGGSICSLILNETGEDAVKWFQGMKDRYGETCINN